MYQPWSSCRDRRHSTRPSWWEGCPGLWTRTSLWWGTGLLLGLSICTWQQMHASWRSLSSAEIHRPMATVVCQPHFLPPLMRPFMNLPLQLQTSMMRLILVTMTTVLCWLSSASFKGQWLMWAQTLRSVDSLQMWALWGKSCSAFPGGTTGSFLHITVHCKYVSARNRQLWQLVWVRSPKLCSRWQHCEKSSPRTLPVSCYARHLSMISWMCRDVHLVHDNEVDSVLLRIFVVHKVDAVALWVKSFKVLHQNHILYQRMNKICAKCGLMNRNAL